MSREELHRLVDSLPEAGLEPAKQALQHFQVWPPQPPPEVERMREEHHQRMLQSMRPGTTGGGGGGGSYSVGSGGRVQHGRFSFSRWEDKTAVAETHHFHKGHEVRVTERMRLGDARTLVYANEIVGPKGETYRQEIMFEIGE